MSLLGAFATKKAAARRRRGARAGLCCRDHARCAGAAAGQRFAPIARRLPDHMYLVASSPRTVVRERVLGLSRRRDSCGRYFYACGRIAFKLLVSLQTLVISAFGAACQSALARSSVRCEVN